MKSILISNDDGYLAPGLAALAEACAGFARITVVAPDRNRSGASNSLTLEMPMRVRTADNGFLFVDGTPTDCVHVAITGLMDIAPDMVIAGINSGANLGDDVLYSGTVAAATEGRFLGYPAIAVSLAGRNPSHYDSAARVVTALLERLESDPLPGDTILNVNVPDIPFDEIRGIRATRLGHRHKSEPVIKSTDPLGREIYWVGPPGGEQDAGDGTDFHAIRNHHVSVTPIRVDLTRADQIHQITEWLPTL
ncbi:MAG: 5'-nucleotidase SurE [marine bacterium B5-7]|nr:MAG: 5'-nucleotidase SurE [marine bacterium B5-7]